MYRYWGTRIIDDVICHVSIYEHPKKEMRTYFLQVIEPFYEKILLMVETPDIGMRRLSFEPRPVLFRSGL